MINILKKYMYEILLSVIIYDCYIITVVSSLYITVMSCVCMCLLYYYLLYYNSPVMCVRNRAARPRLQLELACSAIKMDANFTFMLLGKKSFELSFF